MSTVLQVGDLLEDRFAIVSRLGAGGTATVFLADDPSLERKVAVKVLHTKLTERSDLLLRFRREALALTKLDHPGILKVFRFGLLSDNAPYLVTEYIEGENLRKLLERGPLSCAEAASFGLQIADALVHAHAAGVIHRDVKPDNLMIDHSWKGSVPRITLLDFGLCKAENPLSTGEITVTAVGAAMGTPSYMSPEQCLGRPADPRTDIYSFGCIFFEMLTGAHVFVGDTAGIIMLAHLNSPPPLLSDIDSKTRMPPLAQQILDKCLAKNKERRYASAVELKGDLQILADSGNQARMPRRGADLPASLRDSSKSLSGSSKAKTNRRALLAIAAGTTALAVAFGAALILYTDGGNRLLLSEIEQRYPPNEASPRLVDVISRIKNLRGSRAASLVAFDTANSAYLRSWSIVDRLALDQRLIDVFQGETAGQFPLQVTMLEQALSTMARIPEHADATRLRPPDSPSAEDVNAASTAVAALADGFIKNQSLTPQNWKRLLDVAVQYRGDRPPSSVGWAGLLRLYGEALLHVQGAKLDIDQTSEVCRALILYSAFYRSAPAGENADCEKVLRQSLALAEHKKHVKRAGWAHLELAQFYLRHERFAEARDHVAKAEKCADTAGLSPAETDSLERAKALLAEHDAGGNHQSH